MSGAVAYNGRLVRREREESVLDALLRAGEDIPHSCKAGACQSCLMQMTEGSPDALAQAGLKPGYVAQNYFLACRSRPASDVVVRLPGQGEGSVAATVLRRQALSPDVAAVWLTVEDAPDAYLPGQYVTLSLRGEAIARSYSVANLPAAEGAIEIHVRHIPGGRMSGFLCAAEPGAQLVLRGPAGQCIYAPDGPAADFPILMAGTGTGLAPLLGVMRDALRRGHTGPIRLFHGALDETALYYTEGLRKLAAEHPNVECRFSVLGLGQDAGDMLAGSIEAHAIRGMDGWDKTRTRVYLCGAPEMVNSLKKKVFLAGVPSRAIHSDPFLPSAA
jgi:ferredoxin-NADP reductase/ferredoxin